MALSLCHTEVHIVLESRNLGFNPSHSIFHSCRSWLKLCLFFNFWILLYTSSKLYPLVQIWSDFNLDALAHLGCLKHVLFYFLNPKNAQWELLLLKRSIHEQLNRNWKTMLLSSEWGACKTLSFFLKVL